MKAFEKSLFAGKILGVIDTENQEFIQYSPEELDNLVKLLDTKLVSIKELADELNILPSHLRLIINELLKRKRIKGAFAQNNTFVPNSVIINLAKKSSKQTGKVDIYEISQRLQVHDTVVLETLAEYVINALMPYEEVRISDLSYKTKLPEDFIEALLEKLISEGRISGFLNRVYRTFKREMERPREEMKLQPKISTKPSALWYLVPFFFGIIGGIIAYVGVKDEDEDMANGLLLFGIVWSIILAVLAYYLWLSILSSI